MKVLVVGCGSIGKRHLRNLQEIGVEKVGAVDTREDRREEVRELLGIGSIYGTTEDALADGYDAVVVGVPTAYHTAVARSAVRAGAHVLVEKPVSNREDGLVDLLSEAGERNLVFMVGYTYRFWPPLQAVKQLLDDGAIGRPYAAQITFSEYLPDWHPWEDYRRWFMASKEQGGGAILDESHTIDIARWLFGEIDSVMAVNGKFSHLEIDADDLATIIATFKSGLIGTIHMDIFGRQPRKDMAIIGERGNITWDFYANQVKLQDPTRKVEQSWSFSCERNDMFVSEVRHWLDCVEGRATPPADGHDALRTLHVILAAIESSDTGRRVDLTA